jgi:hypothetical protein
MFTPIQQAGTSSTETISLPSTPSTTSSLVLGSPDHMRDYTIPASAMENQDPTPASASPFRIPDGERKKIPRPPNAFMLFRSRLIHDGKLPPEVGKRQQNISRIAGKAWNLLDEASKNGWRKEAHLRLRDHEKKYPSYKFEPSPKNNRTGLEKIRKAFDDADDDTARRLKALSDVYAKDPKTAGFTASLRPRRQRASPYKSPAKEHTPQRPARGYKTPQLFNDSQLGSPFMSSLISFDSPSPSSTQSLSPLPLHTQPHAVAQGMAQQQLPYMFLPPGLPNHFEQAYQHENGVRRFVIPRPTCRKLTGFFQTIVFPDNYAPVNPYSPPPGYYAFDHTGMVPVMNTSGMMVGTAPNTAAAMLGLYQLNAPYAHYNPNLDVSGSGFHVYQQFAQTSPAPPMANPLSTPLSAAPLTPHEQQVFNAVLGSSHLPLSLEDLVPLPHPLSEDGFMTAASLMASSPAIPGPPSPLSFAKPQASGIDGLAPTAPQSPATKQCV